MTDQPDEARDLVRRAYEADPRSVTFDPSEGLDQLHTRSADSAVVTAAAGHRPTVRQNSPSASSTAYVTAEDPVAGYDGPYHGGFVVELVEEMKTLRRGRRMLEGGIGNRIGRALRAACGVPDGSSPTDTRRMVRTRLTELANQLPDDLRTAVLAAFALLPDTRQRFYQERVRWVAGRLACDERTAQRRINQGFTHLAELLVANMVTGPADYRPTDDPPPAWYTEQLRACVVLDQPSPEALEWRRIVSNQDGLDEIDLAFTLTAPPAVGTESPDRARLNVAMLYGGTLVPREMAATRRFSFSVRLPRPLERNERTEIALRFQVPEGQPMQPHYVCLPRERCKLFDLRVRFDRDQLPAVVWVLAKTFHTDLDDPANSGTKVELDAAGELHLRFEDLAPGFAYGARWDLASPEHLDWETSNLTDS